MGLKRFKNAIRESRANKSYLKFLDEKISRGTAFIEAGQSRDTDKQLSALLSCLKTVSDGIGKICIATGKKDRETALEYLKKNNLNEIKLITRKSGNYRELLSKAEVIVTDDALPAYFIKKENQKLYFQGEGLVECRKGISAIHEATYLGLIQKTLLQADEIICDSSCRDNIAREFMIENLISSNKTRLYYTGDLTKAEDRALAKKIIESGEENVQLAFEGEIKPAVAEFIEQFGKQTGFLQIVPGGAVTFGDYINQYLYKNYGIFEKKAGRYYDREYRRLFEYLNMGEIDFVTTDLYERIEVILRCTCEKVAHRIPMAFYKKLIDVFASHPARIGKVFGRFDCQVGYPDSYGIETWDENICNGIDARLKGIKLDINDSTIRLTTGLVILTEKADYKLLNQLNIGSTIHEKNFIYNTEISNMRSGRRGELHLTECDMQAEFPIDDVKGWYNINIPCLHIEKDGHILRVPFLVDKGKNRFSKKVNEIGNSGYAFEIREDYRHIRFVIRSAMVTDRTVEKIKLAVAFALSLVHIGKRPVVLYEKYCRRYEESASVLFERLIDDGYGKVKYIINKDCMAAADVPEKYRKHLVSQFSFAHYYNLFASGSIFSSEALGHALEKGTSSSLFKNFVLDGSKNYVFLQHGVMYMVALSSEQRRFFRKGEGKGKNRVVVSSQLEGAHFTDNTNYTDEDIYNCGLIKFDRSILNEGADRILVMLTWRPWEFVAGMAGMKETDYYKMLCRIVDAVPENLRDKLVVMPHPLIIEQINPEEKDRVWQYFVPDTSYDDLLKETRLLITDYSSISYDAFYRGSNVVFDWEEKDNCMKEYGENGRLMLTEDLAFGRVCYDSSALAKAIEEGYINGQDEKMIENYRKIVEFHDGNNSGRFIEMAKKDGLL